MIQTGEVRLSQPVDGQVNLSGVARELQEPLMPTDGVAAAGRYEQAAADAIGRFGESLTRLALQEAAVKNSRDVARGVNELIRAQTEAQDRMVGQDPSTWREVMREALKERFDGYVAGVSMSPDAKAQLSLEYDRLAARADASVAGTARSAILQEQQAMLLANLDYYQQTRDVTGAHATIDAMMVSDGEKAMLHRKVAEGFRVQEREDLVSSLITEAESGGHARVLDLLDDPWMEGWDAQVTRYGYKGDTTPDKYSYRVATEDDEYAKQYGIPPGTQYGIGDRGNLLDPGAPGTMDKVSIALSPAYIQKFGLPSKSDGREIKVTLQDGREIVGVWADKTAAIYNGRVVNAVDFYTPDGKLEFDGQIARVQPAKVNLDRASMVKVRQAARRAANQARADRFDEVTELIAGKQIQTQDALTEVLSIRPDIAPSDELRLRKLVEDMGRPLEMNHAVFKRMLEEVESFTFDPDDPASTERYIILRSNIDRALPESAAEMRGSLREMLDEKIELGKGGVPTGPTSYVKSHIEKLAKADFEAGDFGEPTIKQGVLGFRTEFDNPEAAKRYTDALTQVATWMQQNPDKATDIDAVTEVYESIRAGSALPADEAPGPSASLFPQSPETALDIYSAYGQTESTPPATETEEFQTWIESPDFQVMSTADLAQVLPNLPDQDSVDTAERAWSVLNGFYTRHPDLKPEVIDKELRGLPVDQLDDFVRNKIGVNHSVIARRWLARWRTVNGQ